MRDGSFGTVLDPEDVTTEMLPSVDSKWRDQYALMHKLIERTVVVEDVSWNPHRSTDEANIWDVRFREDRPWGRVTTMSAHGFLSRFRHVD